MIEISRIEHISMAVDADLPVLDRLERLLGFTASEPFEDHRLAYRGRTLRMPGAGGVAWEVITPTGPGSYLSGFLRSPRGPGLHHVCCQVPNLPIAIEQLRELGIPPFGLPEPASDRSPDEVFIHPRDGHGVLFQFVEADKEHEPTAGGLADSAGMEDEAAPTLGIAALDHVSHATYDRDMLGEWYERVFGMRTVRRSDAGNRAFETLLLQTPTGQLFWELIEPAGSHSFVDRFLGTRGEALHHVTFRVHDWDQALAACSAEGVGPFGIASGGTSSARWHEAFLHPRDTGGVLLQFYWEEALGAWE